MTENGGFRTRKRGKEYPFYGSTSKQVEEKNHSNGNESLKQKGGRTDWTTSRKSHIRGTRHNSKNWLDVTRTKNKIDVENQGINCPNQHRDQHKKRRTYQCSGETRKHVALGTACSGYKTSNRHWQQKNVGQNWQHQNANSTGHHHMLTYTMQIREIPRSS